MIAFLRGNFVRKTPATVHIDVNGVGYELQISLNTFSAISNLQHGTLHTYLHIREDAHILFGFSEESEKEMFIQLISVSGVGVSTARVMLSSVRPADISAAIAQGNTRFLESVKGIGKKTAERIVLELRDKMSKLGIISNNDGLINNTLEQDALNALIALGIARPMAEQAVSKARKSNPDLNRIEEIVKQALKNI